MTTFRAISTWIGALDLCYGLGCWTCVMDWSVGLVLWTGALDLCYGLECWTCATCFSRLAEDVTLVTKHVGVETMKCILWFALYCIVLGFILLNAFVSLIYWLQETVIIRNTKFAAATVYKLCFIYSSSTAYRTLAQQADMPPWLWSRQ
jgi:hypothetical protein